MQANDISQTSTTERIKEEAYRLIAAKQDVALSPDAIAKELGIVSDEVTQHFSSREEIVTALILDAYHAMGESAEEGARTDGSLMDQWVAACRNVRIWAQKNPEKYALIWGPPLSNYDAPPETAVAHARTALVLIGLLRKAMEEGTLAEYPNDPAISDGMQRTVDEFAEGLMAGLPRPVIARMMIAWPQLLGMLSFAAYGHLQVYAAPDEYFDHAATTMAEFVGLPG